METIQIERVEAKQIRETRSICPDCNKILPATIFEREGKIWMGKTCPEHGEIEELYFGSADMYYKFAKFSHNGKGIENPNVPLEKCACPTNCGLCTSHLSHSGLTNLVITNRCDLTCWYCLPGDEEILVKESGHIWLERIENLARTPMTAISVGGIEGEFSNVKDMEVLAFSAGRVRWTPVRKVFRRMYVGRILEIRTETGRRIRLTPEHAVAVLGNEGLTKKPAAEISCGDQLLSTAFIPQAEESRIDLLEAFTAIPREEQEKICVHNVREALVGSSGAAVYGWRARDTIPLSEFYRLPERSYDVTFGRDASRERLPRCLVVGTDLAKIIGDFVTDGHYTSKDLRITRKNRLSADEIRARLSRLGFRHTTLNRERYKKAPQIVIGSRTLRLIFKYVFGIPEKAPNKRLPKQAFNFSAENKIALLSSLFNDDGHVTRGKHHRSLGFSTTSRGLARDVSFLLASLNIFCRIYAIPKEKIRGARHDLYKLYVTGKDLERLASMLDLRPEHAAKLRGLTPRRGMRLDRVGDFVIDHVKEICESKFEGVVYDLEVDDPSHLFVAGDGLVVSNCFFYAKKGVEGAYVYEPTLDQIREMVKVLRAERPVPGNAIQITGGEPTLRDDLAEIVRICREEGVEHIQLNSNGINLAQDPELAGRVRQAGVNTVYMSFDGVTPRTNPKNHWEAPIAIENCRKVGLGIVLVPTVIKSINDHELGRIIRFGQRNMDVIHAVNFQPVSLTGRLTKSEREKYRITIPDCIERIEEQTNGEVARDAWFPVPSCVPITHFVEALTKRPRYELSIHFACGAGTYVFKDGEKLVPISSFVDLEGLLEYLEEKADELKAGKNKYLVVAKVLAKMGSFIDRSKQPKGLALSKLLFNALVKNDYSALGAFHHKSMFLGMMHFMDKYNHDEERLRRCDIHYLSPDLRIIPFCAFNVIPEWYRDAIQPKYGIPIAQWESEHKTTLEQGLYKGALRKGKGHAAGCGCPLGALNTPGSDLLTIENGMIQGKH